MAELVYPPIIGIFKGLWKYLGLHFDFRGTSHVPRKGPALLAMNHISYLDFALIGTALLPSNRLARFMAKKEIFDHPVAGPLMRGMKHISVDRSNGAPSFHAALKALHHGEIVGVFPEATISQSFELKDMKSGVVRLAIESGAPVLPTVIWGSQRIWTKKFSRNFKRAGTPIYVSIGAPIFFSKEDDPEIGLARVKKEMANLLGEVQSQYPDSYLGERWAPARLGGTAPTPEMVELEKRNRQKREEL